LTYSRASTISLLWGPFIAGLQWRNPGRIVGRTGAGKTTLMNQVTKLQSSVASAERACALLDSPADGANGGPE
jgi:hypothetical protein